MTNNENNSSTKWVAIAVVAGVIVLIITVFFTPALERIRDNICPPLLPPGTPPPTLTPPPATSQPVTPTNPTPEPTPTPTPEPTPPPILRIENAVSIGNSLIESNNIEDNYGGTYLSAFQISRTYNSFAFETLLDGQYKTFTATLFA